MAVQLPTGEKPVWFPRGNWAGACIKATVATGPRWPLVGSPGEAKLSVDGRLSSPLTSRGGSSRSRLRHGGGESVEAKHCCCPGCTCSVDKYRASVSKAVK